MLTHVSDDASEQRVRVQNKGKILVVDDDRLVLATLTHGLSQAGYEVIDADNGDDAILLARQHRPELALLDIRMEGKSGFDVAEYLRDYCQIPFMFLSAFTDEATVNQVKKLGALTYLVKPLDIQQIVPAVEAAFAHRANAPSLAQGASSNAEPQRAEPEVVVTEEAPAPAITTPANVTPIHAAAAEPAPKAETVASAPLNPLDDTIALSVGIVMHRYSLTRQAALDKLNQQAAQENRSLMALCERLLGAQEVLASLGAV